MCVCFDVGFVFNCLFVYLCEDWIENRDLMAPTNVFETIFFFSRCVSCSCLNGFIIITRDNLVISPHNPLSNFTSYINRLTLYFQLICILVFLNHQSLIHPCISFFIVQLIVTWRICFRIMRTLKSVACSGIWYSAQFTRTF